MAETPGPGESELAAGSRSGSLPEASNPEEGREQPLSAEELAKAFGGTPDERGQVRIHVSGMGRSREGNERDANPRGVEKSAEGSNPGVTEPPNVENQPSVKNEPDPDDSGEPGPRIEKIQRKSRRSEEDASKPRKGRSARPRPSRRSKTPPEHPQVEPDIRDRGDELDDGELEAPNRQSASPERQSGGDDTAAAEAREPESPESEVDVEVEPVVRKAIWHGGRDGAVVEVVGEPSTFGEDPERFYAVKGSATRLPESQLEFIEEPLAAEGGATEGAEQNPADSAVSQPSGSESQPDSEASSRASQPVSPPATASPRQPSPTTASPPEGDGERVERRIEDWLQARESGDTSDPLITGAAAPESSEPPPTPPEPTPAEWFHPRGWPEDIEYGQHERHLGNWADLDAAQRAAEGLDPLFDPEVDPLETLELHTLNIDTAVRQRALMAAETRLEQEAAAAKGVKRIIHSIWHNNYAREYYRQKYAAEAAKQIRESGNLYAAEGLDVEAHHEAMDSLIERLTRGGLAAPGERVERMAETPAATEFQSSVKDLIRRYVDGELDAESLGEERTRLLGELRGEHPELFERAKMTADNLLQVAEQAKGMVDHGQALDRILEQMRFYADQARIGARTEVHRTAVDRIIERLGSHKVGLLVNETTVATALAVAHTVATGSAKAGASTLARIAAPVVPGVAGGLIAGVREHYRFGREREQHIRQRAEGADIELTGRRAEMERSRYTAVSAEDLIAGLRLPEGEPSPDELIDLRHNLAEAQLRQEMSDRQNLDLISFSGVDSVETERLELALATARAQAALDHFELILGSDVQRDLMRQRSREIELSMRAQLTQEIRAKDRVFKRMRTLATAKSVARGLLIGATIGVVAQEGAAIVSDSNQGELESLFHNDALHGNQTEHQTLLRSLLAGHSSHEHAAETTSAALATHFERVDGYNSVKLPNGFALIHHGRGGHGGLTLERNGQPVVRGLHMERSGFSPESQQQLESLGIGHEQQYVPVHVIHHETVQTPVRGYLGQHPEGTAHVERTLFYDNNTAGTYDQNELRLDWGGRGGSGLDAHGNYEFNISHMTTDGSSHGELSANAQQLMREGRLRLLVSANEASQSHPFSVPIDEHGNALIERHSAIGRSLFAEHDGQASFTGRYAEVAQVVGHETGREQVRILATEVGPGTSTITHTEAVSEVQRRLLTTLHFPGAAATTETSAQTSWPPIIPANYRREMEPAKKAGTLAPEAEEGAGEPPSEAAAERRRLVLDEDDFEPGEPSESPEPAVSVIPPEPRPAPRFRPTRPTAERSESVADAADEAATEERAERGRADVEPTAEPIAAETTPTATTPRTTATKSKLNPLTQKQAQRYLGAVRNAQDPREITQILNELLRSGYAQLVESEAGSSETVQVVGTGQRGQRVVAAALKRSRQISRELQRATGGRRASKQASEQAGESATEVRRATGTERAEPLVLPEGAVGTFTEPDNREFGRINQDQVRAVREQGIYLVADGMGGEAGGELASKTVADSVVLGLLEVENSPEGVERVIDKAQQDLQAAFDQAKITAAGGTTLVGMKIVAPDRALVFNVGDSALLRVRGGQLNRITPEQFDPEMPNMILNTISANSISRPGVTGLDNPDTQQLSRRDVIDFVDLQPGDRYILCSDGVTGDWEEQRLSDREIIEAVSGKTPEEAARALGAASRKSDDTTALVVDIPAIPAG